jgi:hypothetical protein
MPQIDPSGPNYAGNFRNAAAGLIKSLIRARATQEPTFLSTKDYERWGVHGLESESRSCAQLLTHVRQLRDEFERQFPLIQGSVSEPDCLEIDDIEILAERVAGFIRGDLDEAIRAAASGKKVAWNQLANWGELCDLRDAIDRLPKANLKNNAGVPAVAQSRRVILYGMREAPVVKGKEKPILTPAQYKLVKALIDTGDAGLTKSALEPISTDFWHALNKLKKNDPDWDAVIHFPGPGGRGYWIE